MRNFNATRRTLELLFDCLAGAKNRLLASDRCEALAAPRPSPREREARLGPRRCPRQPPRGGAPAQSQLWPLRAVRLGQRRKRASARICPYRWAHGGKERWAPAREGRGTCAELALRDAARAWACTQGPRASKSKQLGSSQLSLPRELRSHPQASASERPGNRYALQYSYTILRSR